jgi:hypothetical protein
MVKCPLLGGVMVHIYNPSYSGCGGRRIAVCDPLGKKFETLHEK